MLVNLSRDRGAAVPRDTHEVAPVRPAGVPGRSGKPTARIGRKVDLDLSRGEDVARLRRISCLWPELSRRQQKAWLRDHDVIPPRPVIGETEIALLPGGAIALRGPDAVLLPDPTEVTVFNQAEVRHLRRALRSRHDVLTVIRTTDGIFAQPRVPKHLSPQTASIVPSANRLPIGIGFNGPFMVQWGAHGAVAWPMVAAPRLLMLMASLAPAVPAALPRSPCEDHTVVAEHCRATNVGDRDRLVAPAIVEHLSDTITDVVCDDLRLDLMEACVDGQESLAARIALALAVVPACFATAPDSGPVVPAIWRHTLARVRTAPHPRTLLGVDGIGDYLSAVRDLRRVLENAELIGLSADGHPIAGEPVPLNSDAALFLARQAASHGRLALVIPTPVSPAELYRIALDAAHRSEGRVLAIAPSWGFCHRIDANGDETGNAGWFGMGAGLDEVDTIIDEDDP
jgi:hypothetical protein